jgi:hypothetical protein
MARTSLYACAWLAVGLLASATAPATFSPALARVGVTSSSDGDPLGKPPTQDERILRVGIDIQPDELVTTQEHDRVHLVFLDGTSLTVSANARIKIDRFVFDPTSKTGEIAMTASKGVFRLVGGKISKSSAITVQTPSASLGLRGGIGLFTVEANETTARFLFGKSLQVTAAGHTETATRPGTEIHVGLGGAPGIPALIAAGTLARPLQALENARANNNSSPDDQAKRSGFSDQNSGQRPGTFGESAAIAATQAANNALSQIRPRADLPMSSGAAVPASLPPAPPLPPPPSPPPPPPPPGGGYHHGHHHHWHHHHWHHHHHHSHHYRGGR